MALAGVRRGQRAAALAVSLVLAVASAARPGVAQPMHGPGGAQKEPSQGAHDTHMQAPVAIDADLVGDGAVTRLQFTMSAPVDGTVTVLEKPDRIVVDLPEVNFQVPVDFGRKARGLVKSVRYGLVGPGRSRIVVELAAPALPGPFSRQEVLNGAATTMTLELKKAERETFARAAAAQRRERAEITAALPAPTSDRRPVVVLDPGHGGIDTGAIGLGETIEKDVVLAFAQSLRDKLERLGTVRVVLTRSDDTFISLGDRVRMARDTNAALFVSIHADTLSHGPEVRGLTVYTNSERASDADAARVAEAENQADALAGVDSAESTEEVAGILGDLTLRETRTYSHLFAKTLVGRMADAMKLNKNPHRSARFLVLRAPDVPSVLVELGYLSSKSDVDLLRQAQWRDRASDSVASAVAAFLAPRLAQDGGAAAH